MKSGVNYPATLLIASDNDDRVSPFHTFKFLAALQASDSTTSPHVLYYEKKSGHYGNDILEEDYETQAYEYAFIFKYLNMEKQINYGLINWTDPNRK